MIPGKQYKPEDFLEAAWRRRWFIVLPFVLISAATILVAALLPDRYKSEAILLIVPQRVPENYVRATVTGRLDERLRAMSQQIMSRTRLEQIIQEFNLYPDDRQTMIMEDVVERMRNEDVNIGIRGGSASDSGAFAISYESDNPRTAMLVAERLASLFIRENIEDRAVFADMTDQFLQTQLEESRRLLADREARLAEFRRTHAGRLPSQTESNQGAMLNTQAQLRSLQESIDRDRDRLTMLQRLIADTSNLPLAAQLGPVAGDPQAPPSVAKQLENARATLKMLETRLKPDHPDIGMAKRLIRDLEEKASAEAAQQPVTPPPGPAEAARAAKLAEYQAESEQIQKRVASKQEDERRLTAAMVAYRDRIDAAPGLESQLTELMRDYTTLQATYQNLLAKSQEAKVAANMERRQIGEQFKLIDSARLPQRPISPNRLRINMLGALAGLAIGLGFAVLLEYRDTSLRTEDDVVAALSLPVLALVPTMSTMLERERRRRRRMILASSGVVVVLIGVATVAWKFQAISDWIR